MKRLTYQILAPTINKTYEGLTEDEFFDTMEELATMYYATGSPNPSTITFETTEN